MWRRPSQHGARGSLVSPSGISSEELYHLGLAFNPKWGRDKCEQLFNKIDRNKDGTCPTPHRTCLAQMHVRIYHRIRNGVESRLAGTLSIDEFLAFFGQLVEKMNDQQCNRGLQVPGACRCQVYAVCSSTYVAYVFISYGSSAQSGQAGMATAVLCVHYAFRFAFGSIRT